MKLSLSLLAKIYWQAACCWFRVWQLPCAPTWHQLVEIWVTTAMKFTKKFSNHSKGSLIILLQLEWQEGTEILNVEYHLVKQLLDKDLSSRISRAARILPRSPGMGECKDSLHSISLHSQCALEVLCMRDNV
jgi:hypothetical protein